MPTKGQPESTLFFVPNPERVSCIMQIRNLGIKAPPNNLAVVKFMSNGFIPEEWSVELGLSEAGASLLEKYRSRKKPCQKPIEDTAIKDIAMNTSENRIDFLRKRIEITPKNKREQFIHKVKKLFDGAYRVSNTKIALNDIFMDKFYENGIVPADWKKTILKVEGGYELLEFFYDGDVTEDESEFSGVKITIKTHAERERFMAGLQRITELTTSDTLYSNVPHQCIQDFSKDGVVRPELVEILLKKGEEGKKHLRRFMKKKKKEPEKLIPTTPKNVDLLMKKDVVIPENVRGVFESAVEKLFGKTKTWHEAKKIGDDGIVSKSLKTKILAAKSGYEMLQGFYDESNTSTSKNNADSPPPVPLKNSSTNTDNDSVPIEGTYTLSDDDKLLLEPFLEKIKDGLVITKDKSEYFMEELFKLSRLPSRTALGKKMQWGETCFHLIKTGDLRIRLAHIESFLSKFESVTVRQIVNRVQEKLDNKKEARVSTKKESPITDGPVSATDVFDLSDNEDLKPFLDTDNKNLICKEKSNGIIQAMFALSGLPTKADFERFMEWKIGYSLSKGKGKCRLQVKEVEKFIAKTKNITLQDLLSKATDFPDNKLSAKKVIRGRRKNFLSKDDSVAVIEWVKSNTDFATGKKIANVIDLHPITVNRAGNPNKKDILLSKKNAGKLAEACGFETLDKLLGVVKDELTASAHNIPSPTTNDDGLYAADTDEADVVERKDSSIVSAPKETTILKWQRKIFLSILQKNIFQMNFVTFQWKMGIGLIKKFKKDGIISPEWQKIFASEEITLEAILELVGNSLLSTPQENVLKALSGEPATPMSTVAFYSPIATPKENTEVTIIDPPDYVIRTVLEALQISGRIENGRDPKFNRLMFLGAISDKLQEFRITHSGGNKTLEFLSKDGKEKFSVDLELFPLYA